jgi:rhomboid family GlyGly-CTERM serine protease
MDAPRRIGQPRAWPARTLLLCAAVVLIFFLPALSGALVYDRAAIADGQWWRLLSGNLVHHSGAHLALNVAALFVVGALMETRRHDRMVSLCVIAGLGIGLALYLAEPNLLYYGGLSGVVTALLVYLCLHGLRDASWWRWLCLAALMGLAIKVCAELWLNDAFLNFSQPQPFLPSPLSHLAGAATALLFFLLQRRQG